MAERTMTIGFIKAVYTYKCQLCDREEIITWNKDDVETNTKLQSWQALGYMQGLVICSSDCRREYEILSREAFNMCEPGEPGSYPPEYKQKFERLRREYLRSSGL